jgi:hypothetical protein
MGFTLPTSYSGSSSEPTIVKNEQYAEQVNKWSLDFM